MVDEVREEEEVMNEIIPFRWNCLEAIRTASFAATNADGQRLKEAKIGVKREK